MGKDMGKERAYIPWCKFWVWANALYFLLETRAIERACTYILLPIELVYLCMIINHKDITFGLDVMRSGPVDEITLSPCVGGTFELRSPDASGSGISG